MEKKLIYRQLKDNDQYFYQLYKIVDINEDIGDLAKLPSNESLQFYLKSDLNEIECDNLLGTYYYIDNGELYLVNDITKVSYLEEEFAKKYGDGLPNVNSNFSIDNLSKICNEKILFQESSIEHILNILKSNLDIIKTDLSLEQKHRLIHNIILYGPEGFGKTTFAKTFIENTSIPSIILELGDDPKDNLKLLIAGLIGQTMGNVSKAENSIVFIKDNLDELNNDGDFSEAFNLIEELISTKKVSLGEHNQFNFDLSKITFVLMINTPNSDPLSIDDMGISSDLYSCFPEVISFDRLTVEQIKKIILNNSDNVLEVYHNVCKQVGKKLEIAPSFLDNLIKKVYYNVGGIKRINEYIESMIKVRWKNDIIVLDDVAIKEDVLEDAITNELSSENNVVSNNYEQEFKLDLNKVRSEFKDRILNLQQYVKGQNEPLKNILYRAIINDYFQNSNLDPDLKKERINHILIRGGAGSGKSYITGLVAKSLDNKPYVVVDCKRYTQAGYHGKDVDNMLMQLYYNASGDIQKAQKGIIILDEFDKLARIEASSDNPSRGNVQESLLKMLEGTVFDLEIKEGNYTKTVNFDTRETSFIAVGAFEGLDKIRSKRLKATNSGKIGFQSPKENDNYIEENYTAEDMQEFGIDLQILRRFPIQCDLNKLSKEAYRDIMLNSKSSSFLIKCATLEDFGIKVSYDEEFIEEFINIVEKMNYGASGIRTLTERIFAYFETKIIDDDYEEIILTKECIKNPTKVILVPKKSKTKKLVR